MTNEKILDRVRKLLAIAEHPNTGEHEASVALTQANALMAKYAIDEAIARADMDESVRTEPIKVRFAYSTAGHHEFLPYLRTILHEMARTNRCHAVTFAGGQTEIYGMEQDVRWTEMLYLSVYTTFLTQLAPHWDDAKGYDENVYNFKVAGFKWLKINQIAMEHGGPDTRLWERTRGYLGSEGVPMYQKEYRNIESDEAGSFWGSWEYPTEKMTARLKAAYKRHAAKIGDTQPITTSSHTQYRRQYAEAYTARLASRLRELRWAAEGMAHESTGAEVALRDVDADIKNMMYSDYPDLDPKTAVIKREQAQRERDEMLNAMSDKEREAFLEKEQKEARRQARANESYWKRQDKIVLQDAAHRRGRSAADSVDLARKAGFTGAGKRNGSIQS